MKKKTTKANGERPVGRSSKQSLESEGGSTINNQRSKIDISHVAKLANLPLSDQETQTFEEQLSKILGYIDEIEKVDTASVEPTYNVSSNTNITRGDNPNTSLTQKESLQNAPQSKNGFFVTKGVFEK